ncbi:hypothetical protein NHX12_019076 [Muraenolepis orangiensis]|uniref:F-box domain-containing protein n=1 Tax=Muraenolepis orangiensis TaxID=630683 RepID=A0A9Q0EUP0_9TELE|nr:hypothetical protein NHX12_019076 [Muraenolepis orangiensis]
MHLQAYPPLQCSPKRAQQGEILRTSAAGNHGKVGGGIRCPFSVLSDNTPHRHGEGPTHDEKKNGDQEEAWSVVRPGHVREKIAMFAAPQQGPEDPGEACGGGLKVKGGWEAEGRSAKRQRRSRGEGLATGGGKEEEEEEEEEEEVVSVGEMVALLEQRASQQQVTSVPLLSLSHTAPVRPPRTGSQVCVEAVRVWDLVARLESECLKSRSGSGRLLLRGVGRILLAGTSSSSPSSSSQPQPPSGSPALGGCGSCPPGSESLSPARLAAEEQGQTEVQRPGGSTQDPVDPRTVNCGGGEGEEEEEEAAAEPPPGELFFSQSLVYTSSFFSQSPGARGSSQAPPTASLLLLSAPGGGGEQEVKRPGISHRFLEARFKLQLLLEPQSSLLLLPAHLLLHILSLLPTRSLAALKCCCRHFSSLVDAYGVRPADSLWVWDPRYRDDPCKQCKRRYRRGDVSLCRWHHKPYCQALPYGPGYWMCCRSARRDTPGCNVGLHDNRWVPDFHSFTSPIYRRRREEEV